MNRVIVKGLDGSLGPQFFTDTDLADWFKANTDDEGNTTDEIILFEQCEVKEEGEAFTFVLTDYTADRDSERIDPEGWDLKQYKKNPVVFWCHQSNVPAIGKISNLKKVDVKADSKKGIVGKVTFDQNDPFAVLIEGKVKNGFLSKGSVGFRSKKVEILDEPGPDGVWLIHRSQELYEFSIVNIPSNPNATVLNAGEWEGKLDEPTLVPTSLIQIGGVPEYAEAITVETITPEEYGKYILEIETKIDMLNARLDSFFNDRDSSLSDFIFEENEGRETSDPKNRDTSGLDYMFDEGEEADSIHDILAGG